VCHVRSPSPRHLHKGLKPTNSQIPPDQNSKLCEHQCAGSINRRNERSARRIPRRSLGGRGGVSPFKSRCYSVIYDECLAAGSTRFVVHRVRCESEGTAELPETIRLSTLCCATASLIYAHNVSFYRLGMPESTTGYESCDRVHKVWGEVRFGNMSHRPIPQPALMIETECVAASQTLLNESWRARG